MTVAERQHRLNELNELSVFRPDLWTPEREDEANLLATEIMEGRAAQDEAAAMQVEVEAREAVEDAADGPGVGLRSQPPPTNPFNEEPATKAEIRRYAAHWARHRADLAKRDAVRIIERRTGRTVAVVEQNAQAETERPCPKSCGGVIRKPARGPWPSACPTCKQDAAKAKDASRKRRSRAAKRSQGKRLFPELSKRRVGVNEWRALSIDDRTALIDDLDLRASLCAQLGFEGTLIALIGGLTVARHLENVEDGAE
jgi:hypothetical protein